MGKFGQRQNLTQSEYVVDVKRWYTLLLDDKLDISNMVFIKDNIVQVTYKYKDQFVEDSFSTNVFIAAFTTSNARLRLYDMLERLDRNVVYYDTDSVVYIDDGTNAINTDCMLGEWTDELGKDDHITDWISTGPKSYGYITSKGKETMKVKGFTLNHENSKVLNIHSMKNIVDKEIDKVKLQYKMITRDSKTKTLINKTISKDFKFQYDKRMIEATKNGIIDTYPWGY